MCLFPSFLAHQISFSSSQISLQTALLTGKAKGISSLYMKNFNTSLALFFNMS